MDENPYEPPRAPPGRRPTSPRVFWLLTALGFMSVPFGFVTFCLTCTTVANRTEASTGMALAIGIFAGLAVMGTLMYLGSRE